MSLLQRKARPLTRDAGSLRDDRLFIVACDDTFAPKQYFDFFRIPRVKITVVPTIDGTSAAMHVLDRLLEFEHDADDELWMLLDTDHCTRGSHQQSFVSALREAKQRGVNIALSKPCFELWLLLHHMEEAAIGDLATAGEVESTLRGVLGEYNKTKLKPVHYPIESVRSAHARASRLDATVTGGEIPTGNTSRVYKLLGAITSKALPSQLPVQLRDLIGKPTLD
jgi:RloB-like protein